MDDKVRELLMRLAEERSNQQMNPSRPQAPEQQMIPQMQGQQVAENTQIEPGIAEKLREYFKTPPPANPPSSPEDLRQQQYEKIRRENRERMEGSRPIDAVTSQNNSVFEPQDQNQNVAEGDIKLDKDKVADFLKGFKRG